LPMSVISFSQVWKKETNVHFIVTHSFLLCRYFC
jgi:hypothetical protein